MSYIELMLVVVVVFVGYALQSTSTQHTHVCCSWQFFYFYFFSFIISFRSVSSLSAFDKKRKNPHTCSKCNVRDSTRQRLCYVMCYRFSITNHGIKRAPSSIANIEILEAIHFYSLESIGFHSLHGFLILFFSQVHLVLVQEFNAFSPTKTLQFAKRLHFNCRCTSV